MVTRGTVITASFTPDTYTSALLALDKSAAEVAASLILGTDVSKP